MDLKKKFQILIYSFVGFIIFSLATFYFLYTRITKIQQIGPMPPIDQHNEALKFHFIDYVISSFDLSPQQKDKLLQEKYNFVQNARIYRDSMFFYNHQCESLLVNSQFDLNEYEECLDRQLFYQKKLKKLFFEHYRSVYNTLDDTQRLRLPQIFSEFRRCCKPNFEKRKLKIK